MANKSLTFDIFGRDRSASTALQGVAKNANTLVKGFAVVGGAIASAFAVKQIINFGKQVVSFAREMVVEYAAAEDAQFALNDAYARFPALAGGNADALREVNEQLMRRTRFDDDALASGQAVLAQYNLSQEQLLRLTPLLADYAAKTGNDIPTSAEQLGKALLGQGRALKDVGIDFEDLGSVQANYEQLLAGLDAKVGGFAEGGIVKLSTRLEILKNGMGEIRERVGSFFAPAVGRISDVIYEKALPALDTLLDRAGPRFESFLENGAVLAERFFTAIGDSAETGSLGPLGDFFSGLAESQPVFAILGTVGQTLGPIMPTLATALGSIGETLQREGVLDSLSELVVDLLPPLTELLVTTAPLVPPIAAVLSGVLVPALQLVTGNVGQLSILLELLKGNLSAEEFLRAVEDLPIIGDVFSFIGDTIVNVTNTIAGGFNTLIGAIEGAVNGARFLMGMGNIRLPRMGTISTDLWRDTAAGSSPPAMVAGTRVRAFASGAMFRATPGGHLGIFAEAGSDEVALPLTQGVYDELGAGIVRALAVAGGSVGGGGVAKVEIINRGGEALLELIDVRVAYHDGRSEMLVAGGKVPGK